MSTTLTIRSTHDLQAARVDDPSPATRSERIDSAPTITTISNSFVRMLDASVGDVWQLLADHPFAMTTMRAARAFALDDQLTVMPTTIDAARRRVIGTVIWRPDRTAGRDALSGLFEDRIRVTWEVDVAAVGDRTAVSITSRFATSTPQAHARLLEAWPLVGPVAEALARRALASLAAKLDVAVEQLAA